MSKEKLQESLNSADEIIENVKQIFDKHKKIKLGLMQELLDGQVGKNWYERTLSSLAEIITGSTPSTSIKQYWDGNIVWVTPEDLSNLNEVFMSTSSRKITKRGLRNSSAKLIPAHSIVISTRAPIGYIAIMNVDYTTNQGCKSLRLREGSPEFMYYDLLHNVEKIRRYGEGTTFSEISKTQLGKLRIQVPRDLQEQHRIASILLSVDNALVADRAYLNKLINIKAGLVQDLLTGRVRVTG